MDETRRKLNTTPVLAVPVRDARLLLDAGDGDCALLYLHILENGGTLDTDLAARTLHMSERAVQGLAAKLERMGLLAGESERQPCPAREIPEYQAADVVRRSQSDPEFQALVEETGRILGRVLTSTDLKKLFGIYDDLALPADVIMLLVHHCREEHD